MIRPGLWRTRDSFGLQLINCHLHTAPTVVQAGDNILPALLCTWWTMSSGARQLLRSFLLLRDVFVQYFIFLSLLISITKMEENHQLLRLQIPSDKMETEEERQKHLSKFTDRRRLKT